jgi:hypothetical protein
MFCRLYEAKVGTDMDFTSHEKCIKKECMNFDDVLQCTISRDVNIHLDNNKFGWEIDRQINLKELKLTKSELSSYFFDKMIKIIHPNNPDIWIFDCLKKDKESQVFLLYVGGRHKGTFKTMKELMHKLKNEVEYTGRDLIEKDFII